MCVSGWKGTHIECTNPFCFGSPNNWTVGLTCKTDEDCSSASLQACVPGQTCKCCANISHTCSSSADCNAFDAGSPCGCVAGGPGTGQCGPYCRDARLSRDCTTDLVVPGRRLPQYFGRTCTYRGPFPDPGPGFTAPSIRTCRAPAFAILGSPTQRVQDLVGLTSLGTRFLSFLGPIVDVNRALQSLLYVTIPRYNRLYRPPVAARDPLTFDIEENSQDSLQILLSDLGNSGGGDRNTQSSFRATRIIVSAVNNRPTANGPGSISVSEDIPHHFISAPDAQGRNNRGIYITDPDYLDYLFDERIFTVKLNCSNGRLFLNETYLKGEGAGHISYKYYGNGQERKGLHAGESPFPLSCCTDCSFCVDAAWRRDAAWQRARRQGCACRRIILPSSLAAKSSTQKNLHL